MAPCRMTTVLWSGGSAITMPVAGNVWMCAKVSAAGVLDERSTTTRLMQGGKFRNRIIVTPWLWIWQPAHAVKTGVGRGIRVGKRHGITVGCVRDDVCPVG